ncbi:hypothetical protein B194_2869 [Serratia plymuthica A30]|nr:hypothetical protein B194_2869 [Serratia plymuthica A30]
MFMFVLSDRLFNRTVAINHAIKSTSMYAEHSADFGNIQQ